MKNIVQRKFKNIRLCENKSCSKCGNFRCKQKADDMRLVKKRISMHYIPPDMGAIKLIYQLRDEGRFKKKVNYDEYSSSKLIEVAEKTYFELDKILEEIKNSLI